jgi:hypothetical protein
LAATAKTQRRRAQRKPAASSAIQIETRDGIGAPAWVMADLVDVIDGGCGLQLATPLKSGSSVVVRGKFGEGRTAEYLKAGVRWCIRRPDGTFRAGLTFSDKHTSSINSDSLDCYEVMQLSPNADSETISRVYRLLASRYHPDNIETGNSELFIRLSEAYRILSDPDRRASYDARRRSANRIYWSAAEPRKRSDGGERARARDGNGEQRRQTAGALGGWAAALQRL